MRGINRIFGRLLFSTEEEVRFIASHSQERLERVLAKLLLLMADHLTLDYEGQKREKNGQFGKGKKNGGSASNGERPAKVQPNIEKLSRNDAKRAHEMSNAIASGKAKLRTEGMKAHVANTKEYVRHAAERNNKKQLPSFFTCSYGDLADEVKKALKARKAEYIHLPNGETRARIDLGRTIGITFGVEDKTGHNTSTVTVVWSKKNGDWHFYPSD